MADVLALFAISMFTFTVACFGLANKGDTSLLDLFGAIGPYVGILCIVATIMAFLNENLLGTAIFGPLAIFFFTITSVSEANSGTILCILIGIIILIDALVAFVQPVKLLPILLLVAAIAFFVTALWYDGLLHNTAEDYRMYVGVLWMVYSLISFYMAAAILMLVMKGKQILPLLMKA